jgi:mannose-6-phosphate isomerase
MIFKFEPIYLPRIWGGNQFHSILKRNINLEDKIGESWEIVDREDQQSVFSNSIFKGITISDALKEEGSMIMGTNWRKNKKFPILVKWLDCTETLSLQVHPPRSIAKRFCGEPKTENWFIAHANPEASLYIGLKKGTTRSDFMEALKNNVLEPLCHKVPSHRGDSILVESGRIHAIGGGNLILEIQQNSDTTYRVYDWGRKGLGGKERELHIPESMASINFHDFEPSPVKNSHSECEIIAECAHFRIRKFKFKSSFSLKLTKANEACLILHTLNCAIEAGGEIIEPYSQCISPYSDECVIESKEASEFLVTDRF